MKGWYGNKHRHSLASKGVLTTWQHIPEGWDYSQLDVIDKRLKGKFSEELIINMLKKNGFEPLDVSLMNKGLGDILLKVNTECGECTLLIEVKDVEEYNVDKHGRVYWGRPAIRISGHKGLVKNAEELNAIPIYFFKINSMEGDIFVNEYYWIDADFFTKRVNRQKGMYLQPSLHEIRSHGNPVDDKFKFLVKKCLTEKCNQ